MFFFRFVIYDINICNFYVEDFFNSYFYLCFVNMSINVESVFVFSYCFRRFFSDYGVFKNIFCFYYLSIFLIFLVVVLVIIKLLVLVIFKIFKFWVVVIWMLGMLCVDNLIFIFLFLVIINIFLGCFNVDNIFLNFLVFGVLKLNVLIIVKLFFWVLKDNVECKVKWCIFLGILYV